MTCYEFGISIFGNVNYDGLWKNNVNMSSGFVSMMRLCYIILADVDYNEYMFGGI